MNKKDEYINSINKIKVGDNLKKETLNKIKENEGKRNFKIIYKIAGIAAVLILIVSALIFVVNKQNKSTKIETTLGIENGKLPKIGSFDNLYNLLGTISKTDSTYSRGDILKSVDGIGTTTTTADAIAPENYNYAAQTAQEQTETSDEDYSKTNIQVEGVEEADIVKTDGEYIYYFNSEKVVIINAKDPNNLEIVSELNFEEDYVSYMIPEELYVYNDKLIVIGSKDTYEINADNATSSKTTGISLTEQLYVDNYYQQKQYTTAMVYDIKDKKEPELKREVGIEGYYVSSRMIKDKLYLIANKNIYLYNYDPDIPVTTTTKTELTTSYIDTAASKKEIAIGFDDMYYFPECIQENYLNIASFSVENKEAANVNTYLGGGDEIYASEDNLYITQYKSEYRTYSSSSNYISNTYIYKFKLDER